MNRQPSSAGDASCDFTDGPLPNYLHDRRRSHELEQKVLDEMAPDLTRCLDVETTSLYLRKHSMLTPSQAEELSLSHQIKRDRAKKLLGFLVENCRAPATKLLDVLQDMKQSEEGVSPAHDEMIAILAAKLSEQQSQRVRQGACRAVASPDSTYQSLECLHSTAQSRNSYMHVEEPDHHSSNGRVDPLDEETYELSEKYSKFCVEAANHLSKVSSIQQVLLYLSNELSTAKPSVYNIPNQEQIYLAKDIYKVLQYLAAHTCWFDYRLITGMCKMLGEKQGKKLAQRYERKFEEYVRKRITHPRQSGQKMVEAKLAWDYSKLSQQQLEKFTNSFCRVLKCERSSFKLVSVREGCVVATWLVPDYICPTISYYTVTRSNVLDLLGVIWVDVAGTRHTMKENMLTDDTGKIIKQRSSCVTVRSMSMHSLQKCSNAIGMQVASSTLPNTLSIISLPLESSANNNATQYWYSQPMWTMASPNSSVSDLKFSQETSSISPLESSTESATIVGTSSSQEDDFKLSNHHPLITKSPNTIGSSDCPFRESITDTTVQLTGIEGNQNEDRLDSESVFSIERDQEEKEMHDECSAMKQANQSFHCQQSHSLLYTTNALSSPCSSGYNTMSLGRRGLSETLSSTAMPSYEVEDSTMPRKQSPFKKPLSVSSLATDAEKVPTASAIKLPELTQLNLSMLDSSSSSQDDTRKAITLSPLEETVVVPEHTHSTTSLQYLERSQSLVVPDSGDEGFYSMPSPMHSQPYNLSDKTSFSGLILSQATRDVPAYLYMVAKDNYHTESLNVRRGQLLLVLFQEDEEVYVVTHKGYRGFVPLSLCHISSKYLSETNKHEAVCSQYKRFPVRKPPVHDIVTNSFKATSSTELSVMEGDNLLILLEDDNWAYATLPGSDTAGFVPRMHLQELGKQGTAAEQSDLRSSLTRHLSSTSLSTHRSTVSHVNTVSSFRPVNNSFRKEVLGKASPQKPANLHMICIRDHKASRLDEVDVKKGQKVVAMFQEGERILIQTRNKHGYIHQSSCHLSSRYTKSITKQATVSKLRIRANPTGAAIGVMTQSHKAADKLELNMQRHQELSVLFRDELWAYCVANRQYSGFLPQHKVWLTSYPQAHKSRGLYITHSCVPNSLPSLIPGQKVYELLKTQYMVYVRTRSMSKLWLPVNAVQTKQQLTGSGHLPQLTETTIGSSPADSGAFTSLETTGSPELFP